jgi:Flp pilus assembly pilin Flp
MARTLPQRSNKPRQHGTSLVEYALFAALLAVVVIVSIEPLRNLI